METIFTRYKKQKTKGLKGVKKVISESITMFKWEIQNIISKIKYYGTTI